MKTQTTNVSRWLIVTGVTSLLLVVGGLMAAGVLGNILEPASYLPQVEVAAPYPPPPLPTAPPSDLPPRENYTVNDILLIGDTLWVATDHGLVELDTTTSQYVRYLNNDPNHSSTVYALHADPQARLWMGTGFGLYTFEDGSWVRPPGIMNPDECDCPMSHRKMQIDERGRVWLPMSIGARIMAPDGQWHSVLFVDENSPREGSLIIPYDFGSVILAVLDGQDRLWMAHQYECVIDYRWGYYQCMKGGVSVIDDQGHWNHFSPDDGTLRSRAIWGLGTFTDGSVWVNGSGGQELISSDGAERTPGRITDFVTSQAAVDSLVRAEGAAWSVQQDGSVWTWTAGFLRFDGASWVNMGTDRSPPSRITQELVVVDPRRMWARVADLAAGGDPRPYVSEGHLVQWNEETGRWDILYLR